MLVANESPRRVNALLRGLPEESLAWTEEAPKGAPASTGNNVVSIAEFAAKHQEFGQA